MWRLCAALAAILFASGCNDVRNMRRSRDVTGLTSALSNSDPQVRIKAADALGHVGDPRAIGPLVAALGDDDAFVREHAARNLGCNHHSTLGCDTAEARAPLEKILDDSDSFVRLEAARSLGELRDPEAREPLEALVRREKTLEVRREAVLALGRLGDRGARPLLESLEDGGEPRLRAAVEEALRRLATARRRRPSGVMIEVGELRGPDGGPPDAAAEADSATGEETDGSADSTQAGDDA